jgi:hypothetical protein
MKKPQPAEQGSSKRVVKLASRPYRAWTVDTLSKTCIIRYEVIAKTAKQAAQLVNDDIKNVLELDAEKEQLRLEVFKGNNPRIDPNDYKRAVVVESDITLNDPDEQEYFTRIQSLYIVEFICEAINNGLSMADTLDNYTDDIPIFDFSRLHEQFTAAMVILRAVRNYRGHTLWEAKPMISLIPEPDLYRAEQELAHMTQETYYHR